MKNYIEPQTTIHYLSNVKAILSASVTPDGQSTSWFKADDDTEGLDIQVKESSDIFSEDSW